MYLCVVGDIEAQADQAGLELLRAQSARVVLGCGRPVPGEASGGHRPCSNTYSGVSDGEGWTRWDGEVGEVVLDGVGGRGRRRVEGVHHARGGNRK